MADEEYLSRLQASVGHTFGNILFLKKALTAPGAEGDKESENREELEKYDGNRKLAQLGEYLLEFLLLDEAHSEINIFRSTASDVLKSAVSQESRAARAKLFEIDTHIMLSPRLRGKPAQNTLSLAVSAIIGAVWKDSRELRVVRQVLERFGICIGAQISLNSDLHEERPMASGQVFDVMNRLPDTTSDSAIASSSMITPRNSSVNDNTSINEKLDKSMNRELEVNRNASTNLTEVDETSRQSFSPIGFSDFSMDWPESVDTAEVEANFSHISSHEALNLHWGIPTLPNIPTAMPFINPSKLLNNAIQDPEAYEGEDSTSRSSRIFQFAEGNTMSDLGSPSRSLLETVVSPLQFLTESSMSISSPSSIIGLQQSTSDKNSKKRKVPVTRAVSRGSKSQQLETYIALEMERYQSYEMTFPQHTLDAAIRQASGIFQGKDENVMDFKILYFGIGSSESLVALHEIVKEQRQLSKGKQPRKRHHLSTVERIKVVEDLSSRVASTSLQKRCHTYQLYADNSSGSWKTSDGFIVDTTQSVSAKVAPQVGNPINMEDSKISKQIMESLYPGLDPTSIAYRKKQRFVRDQRKLGERYDLLIQKFGYGVLGLLPLPVDELSGEPVLKLTDSLILSIPDRVFKWSVLFLDQMQGDLLRRMSNAVSEAVVAVFDEELDPLKIYGIEHLSPEEIIEHPRGSKELLGLISHAQLIES